GGEMLRNRLSRTCCVRVLVLGASDPNVWSVGIRGLPHAAPALDRKSTRLNSSHVSISYAVFCLKKKKNDITIHIIFGKINKHQQQKRRISNLHKPATENITHIYRECKLLSNNKHVE